jgi:murein DD-endopeptidase MepM/ murein hydrolase activator NlpD
MKAAFVLAAFAAWFSASTASALQVNFYPGDHLYSYELAPDRDAHSVMIQNIAIINDGAAPVTLTSVTIELAAGDRVIDERILGAPELERAAHGGAGLEGGLWRQLSFQFGGDALVPPGVHFATTTTLAPGQAIVLGSQMFAYRGARDGLRVIVNDNAGQGRLPIRNAMSQTVFQFPLQGQWYAGNGPTFHTPHRWSPMEEFAFDLLQVDGEGKTHTGDGSRFADYYAYGKPLFAAAEGRVVLAIADQSEDTRAMQQSNETVTAYYARLQQDQMTRIAQGVPGIAGNSVVIDHGRGEFSFYAHLKPGSVRVRVGDQVTRGQQIGDLGSSGNSTEPHLHFQVCNGPDPLHCAGIPIQFEPSTDALRNPAHAAQVGDFMSRADAN